MVDEGQINTGERPRLGQVEEKKRFVSGAGAGNNLSIRVANALLILTPVIVLPLPALSP